MVLKKPYAFLIKHFKLIHLILGVLLCYIVFKTYSLINFFDSYTATVTHSNPIVSFGDQYLPVLTMFALVFVIVFLFAILWLMLMKKKKSLFYIVSFLFYVVLLFIVIFVRDQLQVLEVQGLDTKTIRMMRDLLFITNWIQFGLTLFILTRAVGLNIKTLNFEQDKMDLEIEKRDNEAFEVNVDIDTDKLKSGIRGFIRNLKYFVIENKYLLQLVVGCTLLLGGMMFLLNTQVFNKIYKEGKTFHADSFNMTVLNSYETDENYQGDVVDDDYKFVVIDIEATNTTEEEAELDTGKMSIIYGKEPYLSENRGYEPFRDLGGILGDKIINPKESKRFILVYKIRKNISDKSAMFRYRTSIKKKKEGLFGSYKKVKLYPVTFGNPKTTATANLGTKIDFKDSILKNSTLKINKVEFDNRFDYTYKDCMTGTCMEYRDFIKASTISNYQKTLMKIDFDWNIDKAVSLGNYDGFYTFLENFATISYSTETGVSKIQNVAFVNQTPNNYPGKELYVEVLNDLLGSEHVNLIVTVRDKKYVYKLK